MNKPIHRPPSIWITQVLLVLPLINLVVALLFSLFQCSSAESSFNSSSPSTIYALLPVCLALALLFLTVWGLQKRKNYGKWLAVSLLVCGMVVGLGGAENF